MTTIAAPPTIDDQISNLEGKLAELQRQWLPYCRVQPVSTNQAAMGIMGGRYDPTLLLRKQEISLQIDDLQIELAGLRAQRAEQHIATIDEELTRAAAELEDARTAYAVAQDALQKATQALRNAQGAHDLAADRRKTHDQLRQQVVRDGQKWRAERARDETIVENATRITRVYSAIDRE